MEIGTAVAIARRNARLSQAEAAKLLGINQSNLSVFENNHRQPTWKVLEKMSKVYGIPVPLILFSSLSEVDLKKDKAIAFKMYKPIIDLIINQLY